MKFKSLNKFIIVILLFFTYNNLHSETIENLPYGHFDTWVTRNIKESAILGGNTVRLVEIGPETTIVGNKIYSNMGGSPWATSNVMANIKGIVKASGTVTYATHEGHGRCVQLNSELVTCKVLGLINIDVMVCGSLFTGSVKEPIKSTSNPYSKMNWGIPYTKRPKSLVIDYKVKMSPNNYRIFSDGFGSQKKIPGQDPCEVFIILQRRWEDANGNIYAKRVGTARELYSRNTQWIHRHHIPVIYGDMSAKHTVSNYKPLLTGKKAFYAQNKKGKLVPIQEIGWDNPNAIPTHVIFMASSGSGTAFLGAEGNILWLDNVGFGF